MAISQSVYAQGKTPAICVMILNAENVGILKLTVGYTIVSTKYLTLMIAILANIIPTPLKRKNNVLKCKQLYPL